MYVYLLVLIYIKLRTTKISACHKVVHACLLVEIWLQNPIVDDKIWH